MDTQLLHDLSRLVVEIAQKASESIMDVYLSETVAIRVKKDGSPVTEADINSHKIIIQELKKLPSRFPILSEEGHQITYKERKEWEIFWLVDPLDGTKDFIKKNGEFTVNIALVEDQTPVFGVVYAPAVELLFWGSLKDGAWKKEANNKVQAVSVAAKLDNTVKIAASRSHPSDKMNTFLEQFKKYKIYSMGSSLKICRVSDGSVHLYPRLGPTMEWDTAAAHAVLKSAGGEMIKYGTGSFLRYNKQELLNPEFIAGNLSIISGLGTCI